MKNNAVIIKQIIGDVYRLDFPDGKSYVGASIKGAKRRYKEHAKETAEGKNKPLNKAWRKLGPPILVVLKTGLLEKDLWSEEKDAIAKYNTLVPFGYNVYSGRDTPPGMLGKTYAHTKDAKKRIGNGNRGKVRTPEQKKELSEAHLKPETRALLSRLNSGKNNPRYGIPHSKKTRKKMSLAHTGKKHTPEHNANKSKALKGRVLTPEWKANISAAKLGKKLTKEHRAKLCIAQQASWDSGRRKRKI